MRVLCVCLGNICRSPAAQGVIAARRPDWTVDSAGTSDWHVGEPPYPPMQAAARARGYDLSDQRARQVGAADFGRFDLILAMDDRNLADLEALNPGNGAALRALIPGASVPDPYYTRDFDGCLDIIEAAVDRLLDEAEQPASGTSSPGRPDRT